MQDMRQARSQNFYGKCKHCKKFGHKETDCWAKAKEEAAKTAKKIEKKKKLKKEQAKKAQKEEGRKDLNQIAMLRTAQMNQSG